MNKNENNTLDDILSAAKAEFSEKGFRSASLRRIVKKCRCDNRCILRLFQKQGRIV